MKFSRKTGWWFPDKEKHMIQWMLKMNREVAERKTYQYHKYEACFPYIRTSRDICIDVGAHIGTWSYYMAQDFQKLIAFEPVVSHAGCWRKNVQAKNAVLVQHALGNYNGRAYLSTRTVDSSGDTSIDVEEMEDAQETLIFRLDDLELLEGSIDFVKIDCEGFELFVLHGMKELLLKYEPCIIVEQKPETGGFRRYGIPGTAAIDYLKALGAIQRRGIQGDYILSWP